MPLLCCHITETTHIICPPFRTPVKQSQTTTQQNPTTADPTNQSYAEISQSCEMINPDFSTFVHDNAKTSKTSPHCVETVMMSHHRWFTDHDSH
jgi:hypothetical protein